MAGLCAVLTYKGPGSRAKGGGKAEGASPYKIREEHELRISNYEEIERILEGLGLRRSFRYEKFRTTYGLPGMKQLKVEFDETPIGVFIELEGPRGEIDRAAGRLGFSREEYIKLSYGALFLQECGRGHKRKSGGTGGEESDGASQNEPIRFSGIPDMLFRRSK